MRISDWSSDVCSSDLFVINDSGEVRGVDWDFNAWGGFEGGLYAPWNRDSQVASKILEIERSPRYRTDGFVLEDGSIHFDGECSEARRVGKEWVSTCRARGSPDH